MFHLILYGYFFVKKLILDNCNSIGFFQLHFKLFFKKLIFQVISPRSSRKSQLSWNHDFTRYAQDTIQPLFNQGHGLADDDLRRFCRKWRKYQHFSIMTKIWWFRDGMTRSVIPPPLWRFTWPLQGHGLADDDLRRFCRKWRKYQHWNTRRWFHFMKNFAVIHHLLDDASYK